MENKNELIVGLDVGSNSVGWAVVEMNGEHLERIHGMGSRIIPMGDEKKEFEQGAKITKNNTRRQKRSMRRNHQRYKLRRANLVKALKLMDAWPDGLGEQARANVPVLTPLQVYGLRAMAAVDPISLTELGRVLYHMNQRRGYKDIGDLMDEQDGAAPGEAKDDGKRIERVFIESVEVDDDKGKKVKYLVRLGDGREGTCTLEIIQGMVGTEQELEVTTKKNKAGERYEFRLAQKTDWRKGMESINAAIDASGLTPGQFFHQQLKDDAFYRIRERIVLRDTFKKEFDTIWTRQLQAHANLGDEALRDRVVKALIPNNLAEQAKWLRKDLGSFIRDYVIYYQRPLKSQVSNKGQCRFETGVPAKDGKKAIPPKPVMPVSSPIYQLFRIWQQVNNIRLIDKYAKEQELAASERVAMVEHLLQHPELKADNLLKVIGRKGEPLENNLRANLPGHQTLAKLRPVLKKTALLKRLEEEASELKEPQNTLLFRIWHILYSIPIEQDRVDALQAMKEVPEELIEPLAKVRFERKHGAVSARAASRILPLMVCGDAWSAEYVHERDKRRIHEVIDKISTGEEIDRLPNEVRVRLAAYTSLDHYQGMPYWLAASVLYGDHRAATAKPFDRPEEIKPLGRGFLRNPVVEQVVNETLMIMRDIWSTYGRPTSVRVELARELRQNQKERARTFENNKNRDKARKEVVETLTKEFHRPKPSRKDIERYELWLQQGMTCIYSNKPINKSQLFDSRDTDIDHIIPQKVYYDDSIQNKVLVLRQENADKGKQLGALYMKSKGPGEYEAYVDRVNKLKAGRQKKKYLLAEQVPENFINRQLQETRYIGTKVTELLQPICTVKSTLGIVTDALKNEWGLDKVFKEILIPRFERLEGITGRKLIQEIPLTNGNKHKDWKIEGYDKRIDHRHHALDALVVALTRQGYIQRLSNLNQMDGSKEEKEAMKRPTWYPLPHPDLRTMVRTQLERAIPSIKNRKRLLTKTTNETRFLADATSGRTGLRKQTKGDLRAVRGPLHNEQPLGEIKEQHKWDVLKFFKQLKGEPDPIRLVASDYPREERLLAHEWQRQKVHEHLTRYDGNVEALMKAWKKDPIKGHNGEALKEVTVIERKYSKMRSLNPTFTASQLGMVIDRGLRRDLEQHILRSMPERSEKERLAVQLAFALYEKPEPSKKEEKQLAKFMDKGIERAFTVEGLQVLNRNRKVPLRQVKCKMDDALVDHALSRERLLKRGDLNRKRFVEKFEKYALVIHVDRTTGKREPEPVSLFDAVERTMKGHPIAEDRPNCKQFVLKRNSLVYVPRPGEEERDVDWADLDQIGQRLYRAVKFSTQNYFLPVTISTVVKLEASPASEQDEDGDENKAPREYGTQDCTEWVDSDNPRTKILERFIPVELDRLGRKIKPLQR